MGSALYFISFISIHILSIIIIRNHLTLQTLHIEYIQIYCEDICKFTINMLFAIIY